MRSRRKPRPLPARGRPHHNPRLDQGRSPPAERMRREAVTPVGMGDPAGTRPPRHSSGVGVVRWCQGSTARLGRVGGVAVRWWIHRRALLHGGAVMLRRWSLLGLLVVMLLVRVGVEWSTHDVPFLGPVSVGSYPHRPRQHPKFAERIRIRCRSWSTRWADLVRPLVSEHRVRQRRDPFGARLTSPYPQPWPSPRRTTSSSHWEAHGCRTCQQAVLTSVQKGGGSRTRDHWALAKRVTTFS